MRRLHFFTEYYYPVSNSTSFYITKIIQACAEKWEGDINVFCASPKPDCEILSKENTHITRFSDGGLSKNHLLSRVLRFLLITLKFSWAAIWKIKKGNSVFSVTNPAFFLLFLAFLRKIRKFRFILLVYDIFPEVLIPGGLADKNSMKYRMSLKSFNWAYKSADTIIVIGRDMQEVVEKKVESSSKTVFIPNWSDTEHIFSVEKSDNPILKRLGIEQDFVFSVAGNMGRTQGLDNILNALSICKFDKGVAFVFMGGGAKTEDIKEEISKRKICNTYVTGWIPDEEQNAMLSACDVAVISLAAGMYGLSVPSKSYFNMAAGKPLLLIADERSEIARVIKEYKIGWVVPPNNPEALVKCLNEIKKTPQTELTEFGIRARRTAENVFSERIVLPEFVRCICEQS